MMDQSGISYLSIPDQQKVIEKLSFIADRSPSSETLFYHYGGLLATGTLIASNFVYWRTGFSSFNLRKYSKYRILSLVVPSIFCCQYGLLYHLYVSDPMYSYFRPESTWHYARNAFLAHLVSSPVLCFITLGITFANAQLLGMIPIGNNFLKKDGRKEAIEYVMKRIKPHSKRLAMTHLIASAVITTIGACEYKQSCTLLSKVGRKTLSHRENVISS